MRLDIPCPEELAPDEIVIILHEHAGLSDRDLTAARQGWLDISRNHEKELDLAQSRTQTVQRGKVLRAGLARVDLPFLARSSCTGR